MDDFDLDVYEKCIDIKNSSVARLGKQLLKENNQHERIMKIMNMTRYCLYQKIRKLENLLDKYELKKRKKAKGYVISKIQMEIEKLKRAKEILDQDIKYLENKENKEDKENKEKQYQRSIARYSKDN
jgi:hypothetical protein